MQEQLLSSGEAAKRMNVSKPTVSLWEREGKIVADGKTQGGHCRYSRETIRAVNEKRFAVPEGRDKLVSPLKYPGGKTRAVPWLLPFVPKRAKVMSPFVGGGSFELALVARGHEVTAYDGHEPLSTFWSHALRERDNLAQLAMQLRPLTKRMYQHLKMIVASMSASLEMAAAFFIINRTSYSGLSMSGGMSTKITEAETVNAINRIRDLDAPSLRVGHGDFRDTIPRHPDDFVYADPPYLLEKPRDRLYGTRGDMHMGFDHEALAELLNSRGNWLLSYNDCPRVRSMYSGCEFIQAEWSYAMSKSKQSNEVLIRPKGS